MGVILIFATFSAIFSLNTSFIFSKFSSLNVKVVLLQKGVLVIILMARLCIFFSGFRSVADATPNVVIQN